MDLDTLRTLKRNKKELLKAEERILEAVSVDYMNGFLTDPIVSEKIFEISEKFWFSNTRQRYTKLILNIQILAHPSPEAFKKLFTNYPTNGIVVKINYRKLQLIREKSIKVYPHWAMVIKY